MKKSEKNAIVKWAASLTDEELEKAYYDAVYDSLGSQTEEMYERGYDIRDIEEREKHEKFLCEKSSLLGMICEERGLKLWENPRKTEYAVEVYGASGAFDRQLDAFNSFEEAEKFKNDCDEPLADGEYIGVLAIHYDEHGNENTVERL